MTAVQGRSNNLKKKRGGDCSDKIEERPVEREISRGVGPHAGKKSRKTKNQAHPVQAHRSGKK